MKEEGSVIYMCFMHTFPVSQSHIALDNLSFSNCEPSGECQSSIDFQCANEYCIPRQEACDAKYDCMDKSDEYQCPDIKVSTSEVSQWEGKNSNIWCYGMLKGKW